MQNYEISHNSMLYLASITKNLKKIVKRENNTHTKKSSKEIFFQKK